MWRHLAPHDASRTWQRRAMVGRDGFEVGQQQVVLTLHGGLLRHGLCMGNMCSMCNGNY